MCPHTKEVNFITLSHVVVIKCSSTLKAIHIRLSEDIIIMVCNLISVHFEIIFHAISELGKPQTREILNWTIRFSAKRMANLPDAVHVRMT